VRIIADLLRPYLPPSDRPSNVLEFFARTGPFVEAGDSLAEETISKKAKRGLWMWAWVGNKGIRFNVVETGESEEAKGWISGT
jgi:hypothetical protein